MELSHRVDLKIVMTGGSLIKSCFALTGPSVIASVNEMFYDLAFICVDGVHPEHGLTSDSPELGAGKVELLFTILAKTIVVADHSKFGKVGKTLIAPVENIDLIITDKGYSSTLVRRLVEVVWV
jgi:DeoR family transcriptional regulator of aga operon